MYGIQTGVFNNIAIFMFENDVKMYGIQTLGIVDEYHAQFENDVKMYGIQTHTDRRRVKRRLRMM